MSASLPSSNCTHPEVAAFTKFVVVDQMVTADIPIACRIVMYCISITDITTVANMAARTFSAEYVLLSCTVA